MHHMKARASQTAAILAVGQLSAQIIDPRIVGHGGDRHILERDGLGDAGEFLRRVRLCGPRNDDGHLDLMHADTSRAGGPTALSEKR